ncbi:methyl-accepting chemotaxis protein [Gracilibacillus sp. D59]|uniref:methyl-accepting chemotaxis protein n=1 Tax=Gracilibacillus sp. D59 TaxID=3457434 RepID=UPI003FCD7047
MKKIIKNTSLNKQFSVRVFLIMLIIAVFSGIIQLFMMYSNVEERARNEANSISASIQQGIKETNLATHEIEHQIDLKLKSYAQTIAEKLNGKSLDEITNKELIEISKELDIAGISLLQKQENEIVGVRSTDEDEIGFRLSEVSPYGYEVLNAFMDGNLPEEAKDVLSYSDEDVITLFTAQSGSHGDTPMFYKYAYHLIPEENYVIDPYIEANEVYQFTQNIGPEKWIDEVIKTSEFAKEIAVLDPRVYDDPSLAENIYPPLTKIVNGDFNYEEEKDTQILVNMLHDAKGENYIKKYNGNEIYKSFIPIEENKVLYVALDYGKMKAPMYKQLFILIGISILALVILLFFTTRFFNNIYKNIQKIIDQILQMEKGDFTVQSSVKDKGELESLSQSTNKLADTLNRVLSETSDQAIQTEKHAYLLESEANNSVDKVYTMSMSTTTEAREQMDEMNYVLDQIEKKMSEERVEDQEILTFINQLREQITHSSNSTTEMTITLSDLLKSLHNQSESLSDISKKLLENLEQFTLDYKDKSN